MRKLWKRCLFCFLITAAVWCGQLMADRNLLNEQLIRIHVVANSDSAEDQNVKLQVRDAVINSIKMDLRDVGDAKKAKTYLQENLPKIQQAANEALQSAGFEGIAIASLHKETFDTRFYETFSLPSGVYDALRITIGKGEGKNWWCVAYPSLCIPVTTAGFQNVAAGAGFSETLGKTLVGETGYEIRFFLLDAIGKVQNILFQE